MFCYIFIHGDQMNFKARIILHHFNSRPNQECQKIFKAVGAMDATQVKTKLIGYGFSLLEGIDPNPEVISSDRNYLPLC